MTVLGRKTVSWGALFSKDPEREVSIFGWNLVNRNLTGPAYGSCSYPMHIIYSIKGVWGFNCALENRIS